MKELLPFIIVGIASGSVYGLAGVGLVLTFRTSGVLNFAHGATAAAGAFLFYWLHVEHGLAWPLACVVTLVVFGVVGGLALERLTRSLNRASPVAVVVLTVGLLLATQGFLALRFGDAIRYFPAFLPTSGFHLAGVGVGWDQVIGAAVALAGAAGLYAFLRLSHTGRSMRAVVENPTLVQLTGQRPATTARIAWAIGTSFAALSGLLLAPTLGLDATLLTFLVVQSFGACAIGLFKSLPLTYVGGLVVGVAASLATKYITVRPWTGLPSAVPFLILIVVLVAVSNTKLPDAGGRIIVADRRPPRPAWRTVAVTVIGGGALVALPFLVGTYLPLWTNALSLVVIVGSLALLLWTSGQLSLCHLSFAALGATTVGHLTGSGVPWFLALVAGGLVAVPVGALVAIPAIRLSGIYLGLVTLGFAILMQNVVFQSGFMFGTETAVSTHRPVLGFVDGRSDTWFYFVVLAVAAVVVLSLLAIQRAQLGRLLRAMAESPVMLATSGLDVSTTKVLVFCASSFFAAIGGGLLVTQYGSIAGLAFSPLQSLLLVAVLGICGTALVRSSVLAAVLIAVLPGYVHALDTNTQQFVFGVAAVVAGLALANRPALAAWFARSAAETEDRVQRGPIPERVRAARRGDRDARGRRRPVFAGRGAR